MGYTVTSNRAFATWILDRHRCVGQPLGGGPDGAGRTTTLPVEQIRARVDQATVREGSGLWDSVRAGHPALPSRGWTEGAQ